MNVCVSVCACLCVCCFFHLEATGLVQMGLFGKGSVNDRLPFMGSQFPSKMGSKGVKIKKKMQTHSGKVPKPLKYQIQTVQKVFFGWDFFREYPKAL